MIFGRTISISYPASAKEVLKVIKKNDYIFISLHIEEEYSNKYDLKYKELCDLFYKKGVKIIADVSLKTKKFFNENDLVKLANKLHLYALRIDYGIPFDELILIAKKIPIVINASTVDFKEVNKLIKISKKIIAMHNYYPRPETGLDIDCFNNRNKYFKFLGIEVFSFIHGDGELRLPLKYGLPTLEHQRNISPYISFVELSNNEFVDGIFVGDPNLSYEQLKLINDYNETKIIKIKAKINKNYEFLFNKILTSRIDSPNTLIRVKESREYSCKGKDVEPFNTIKRKVGSITIDNKKYERYSGELMIVKKELNKDEKVNVIGVIKKEDLLLLTYIRNNSQFELIAK